MSGKIRLAFRLDDPSSHSDHALEEAIIGILENNGIPATFAVIPFSDHSGERRCLAGSEVPHLLRAHERGILEIALHGYLHNAFTRLPDDNQTEFATRPPGQQLELLHEGKVCLEQTFGPIRGFVPPWNSFDGTTLKVLGTLGFHYLSGGWEYVPGGMERLPVLPHSCNLAYLDQAIAEARGLGHLSPVIVAIMHHYDFRESGSRDAVTELAQLDRLLASVADQPDIEIMSLANLAESMRAENAAANVRFHHWREQQHWRLNCLMPGFVLLDVSPARLAGGLVLHALRNLPRALLG